MWLFLWTCSKDSIQSSSSRVREEDSLCLHSLELLKRNYVLSQLFFRKETMWIFSNYMSKFHDISQYITKRTYGSWLTIFTKAYTHGVAEYSLTVADTTNVDKLPQHSYRPILYWQKNIGTNERGDSLRLTRALTAVCVCCSFWFFNFRSFKNFSWLRP